MKLLRPRPSSEHNIYCPNATALRRVAALLILACLLASGLLVATIEQGWVPKAAAQTPINLPRDEAVITVLADGTHAGPGTETFLNSANGYNPGDNTIDDRVVASGDAVTFQVALNVAAGPARTIRVDFTNSGGALELGDFSKLSLSSSTVKSTWSNGGLDIQIPRGATGKLVGTVTVRAKDTAGMPVAGNMVTATVKNGTTQVFKSNSDAVTVISAPLADLTVDTVAQVYRSYTQDSAQGEFSIDPVALKVEGYSSAGLIASTQWKTDIDVSSFPAGTVFTIDGVSIPVVGGVLKDVTGVGSKRLVYVLPADKKPTKENPVQNYQIHLVVSPDAFQVGETKNIADPGNGQPSSYATSTHTVNGQSVGALNGRILPNNNYSSATWYFFDTPPDLIWRYDVAAPWNSTKTYFEKENLYWNQGSSYASQGFDFPYRGYVTNDNDLYGRVTVLPQNIDAATAVDSLLVGDKINTSAGDVYRPHDYDTTRQVVVTVGGVELSPELYKVQFRDSTGWVESDQPVAGAMEARVSFAPGAFATGKEAGKTVQVFFPLKAHNNYDPAVDSGKLLVSQGSFAVCSSSTARAAEEPFAVDEGVSATPTSTQTISSATSTSSASTSTASSSSSVSDVTLTPSEVSPEPRMLVSDYAAVDSCAQNASTMEGRAPLTFAKAPTVSTSITAVGDPQSTGHGTMLTSWSIADVVQQPPVSEGYSATRTITLDKVYDPATLKLTNNPGWVIDHIDGQNVVLKRLGIHLDQTNQGWSMGPVGFTVETIPNPASADGKPLTGVVSENITLAWSNAPGVADGTSTATSSASQLIDSSNTIIPWMRAVDTKVQIEDPLRWEAIVGLGRMTTPGSQWSQDIVLPYNGDIEKIQQLNSFRKPGQPPITIDDTTGLDTTGDFDGVGRSKFNGTYDVSKVTVTDVPPGTKVWLGTRDGAYGVEKTVNPDGTVDLTGVDATRIQKISVRGVDNSSELQAAGMRVLVDVVPHGNKEGDQYVMWLEPTSSPALPGTTLMAWPEGITVVMSEIEGTLFQDANSNSSLDKDEAGRLAGVAVVLQHKVGDVWVDMVDTADHKYATVTDAQGHYRFEGLHSGEYQVKLKNVEKDRTDSMDLDTVAGQTGTAAKDGDLTQSTVNRFNVTTATRLTRSYNKVFNNTNDTVSVTVGVDQTVTRVDFGFVASHADAALDKSPATVTKNSDGTSTVSWDVTVTNTGDVPLKDLQLSDRTSIEVVGLQAQIGGRNKEQIGTTGVIKDLQGIWPEALNKGFSVATSDGFWIGTSGNDLTKLDVTGDITQAIGRFPLSNSGGYAVASSDGVWVGNSKLNHTQVPGVTGEVQHITGFNPLYSGAGYAVGTTDGLWVGSGTSLVKVSAVTGKITHLAGNEPNGAGGYIVATDDGIWVGSGEKVPTKIAGISGTVTHLRAHRPNDYFGYVVGTTEGLWTGVGAGVPVKDAKVKGPIKNLSGESGRLSSYGFIAENNEGWWLGSGSTTATLIGGITGSTVGVIGSDPTGSGGFAIATSAGLWVGSNGSPTKIIGPTGELQGVYGGSPLRYGYVVSTSDGMWVGNGISPAVQIEGISGVGIDVATYEPKSPGNGFVIGTSTGLFVGHATTAKPVNSFRFNFDPRSDFSPSGEPVREKNIQGREFERRTFSLPEIKSGDYVTVHLSGVVRDAQSDLVVGNQAWVTSRDVDRAGIAVATNGAVQVTGAGMDPGVPDVPLLPAPASVDPAGIHRTVTASLNTDAGVDERVVNGSPVDDLADQTPALLKAVSTAVPLTASISGVTWYDTTPDGVRDPAEPRVSGVRVVARIPGTGTVVGEAVTDASGQWTITGLKDGEQLEVSYDVVPHVHDGKSWTPVVAGGNPGTSTDSDINAVGFVTRGAAVVARNGGSSGMADAGLQVLDAGINIIKGGQEGDDRLTVRGERDLDPVLAADALKSGLSLPAAGEVDPVSGGFDDRDGDPRTNAYVYKVENTGQNKLTDIVLADVTTAGVPAVLSTRLVYSGNPNSLQYELQDRGGKLTVMDTLTGQPLVLNPGESLTAYVHVGFTTGNERHADTLSVTAAALNNGGDRVATVSDQDEFSSTYEKVPPKRITLRKVDDFGRNGPDEKVLAGAGFLVESTSFADLESVNPGDSTKVTGEVGRFVTGADGQVSFDLRSGIYKVTETRAPSGYHRPDPARVTHFIKVGYDEKGQPVVDVKTVNSSQVPDLEYLVNGGVEVAASAGDWGTVEIDNAVDTTVKPVWRLPETGLASLALLGLAALGLLAGYGLWLRRGKRRDEQSLEELS
ncbi:SdrD B-like domain-containing protein [Staphylococcus chromogenes]|nr:SdrD B-like domain-containing protein [Staphylococcus chromogenes]